MIEREIIRIVPKIKAISRRTSFESNSLAIFWFLVAKMISGEIEEV